ncbi:MAG: LuxR C-terminal-related transcriptional regulator [Adlercreutzia equolifaciens]
MAISALSASRPVLAPSLPLGDRGRGRQHAEHRRLRPPLVRQQSPSPASRTARPLCLRHGRLRNPLLARAPSPACRWLYFTYPLAGNDLLINSLLGALVLISTQVVLVQFTHAERGGVVRGATIARRPRTSESRARPKGRCAGLMAALAEAEQTPQSVAFNAARARGHRPANSLRGSESRRGAPVHPLQRGVRRRSGSSFSGSDLASMPSPPPRPRLPPGDDAVASRLFSLGRLRAIPCPFPCSHYGASWSGFHAAGNVERMGEHFPLTSREMDVLTLYALGHTQKKVAEELFITPATAPQPHQAHLQ